MTENKRGEWQQQKSFILVLFTIIISLINTILVHYFLDVFICETLLKPRLSQVLQRKVRVSNTVLLV